MLRLIDRLLNKITMYRLMFYYLVTLLGVGVIFGALRILPYSPIDLLFSLAILTGVAWLANRAFAWVFHAQTNVESVYITAFILALIITPVAFMTTGSSGAASTINWASIAFLACAAIFAMGSKYILAIRKKHIFNPAAIAVALTAILLGQYASWWVGGNLALLPFVLIGGLLVVRKLQRFDLVLAFTAGALISIVATNTLLDPATAVEKAFTHTTLLFFAFVMLTEPLTTPPTRARRIAYGAFVGLIFSPAVHLGSVYSTPELALIVGNVLSYILSPKAKYIVKLKEKREIGTNIDEFVFAPPGSPIKFKPGQYMEWTLSHPKSDSRGNRRYFTLASSPTEADLRIGIKFYSNLGGAQWSSFKEHLASLKPGDTIMAGQLAGDFTLPRNPRIKLAFIAGGIGITPFRSMAKYLSDTATDATARAGRDIHAEHRSVTLLYSAGSAAEFCFKEIFDEAAQKFGMKTVYIEGRIDPTRIAKEIPDYLERTFYLSGPRNMVNAFEDALQRMHVPRRQIRTDFFPGLA